MADHIYQSHLTFNSSSTFNLSMCEFERNNFEFMLTPNANLFLKPIIKTKKQVIQFVNSEDTRATKMSLTSLWYSCY